MRPSTLCPLINLKLLYFHTTDLHQDIIIRYENLVLKHNEFAKEHKVAREQTENWIQRERALTNNVLNLQNLMVSMTCEERNRLLA